jgi:hypothetical protein
MQNRKTIPSSVMRSAAVVFVLAIFLAGLNLVSPSPTEARPLTCRFGSESTLPTREQYQELTENQTDVGPDEQLDGARSGIYRIFSSVSSSCLRRLSSGSYHMRAQWTVRMKLLSGWPESSEYSEYPSFGDANISTYFSIYKPYNNVESGFTNSASDVGLTELLSRAYGSYQTLASSGLNELQLTELCYSETCRFSYELVGIVGDTDGQNIYGIDTHVAMCFRHVPADLELTVLCSEAASNYYAHPGTFGMTVSIQGSITFEPSWLFRR